MVHSPSSGCSSMSPAAPSHGEWLVKCVIFDWESDTRDRPWDISDRFSSDNTKSLVLHCFSSSVGFADMALLWPLYVDIMQTAVLSSLYTFICEVFLALFSALMNDSFSPLYSSDSNRPQWAALVYFIQQLHLTSVWLDECRERNDLHF